MDELDQLAFDIQAFLFQNIFDASLQNDGTLIQGNNVYCHQDKDGTVLPVVVKPALCDYQGSAFEISLFDDRLLKDYTNYKTNNICERRSVFLNKLYSYLCNKVCHLPIHSINKNERITLHLLPFDFSEDRINAEIEIECHPKRSIYYTEIQNIFSPNNLLLRQGFNTFANGNLIVITFTGQETVDKESKRLCLLLNIVNFILIPLCKLNSVSYSSPKPSILNLTLDKINQILSRNILNTDKDYLAYSFSFKELAITQNVVSSMTPSSYSIYQNTPPLVVSTPPINVNSVNYLFVYQWIIDEYKNYPNKEDFEEELLFLFRIEFELLKRLKDNEKIHPFNLDRPLFTIYENINIIQLRPKDLYSCKFKDPAVTVFKDLQPEQQENFKLINTINNTDYDTESQKFIKMNSWGTLYLLHVLTFQRTKDINHHFAELLSTAYEVYERLINTTDEFERHTIPTEVKSLYTNSPLNDSGDFSESMEITPKDGTFTFQFADFIGEEGQTYYHALKLPQLHFFIPEILTSVSYLDFPVPLLLPPKHHRLLNIHRVNYLPKPLVINPNLTEAVSSNGRQLSWWGGNKTLDSVDMEILSDQSIVCICHGLEDFELSLKVCERLTAIDAKPKIRYEAAIYEKDKFPELAEQLQYKGDMHGFEAPRIQGPKIEVIKGYFSTRECILLLGEAKVGKTFVGLSLALAITSGKSMHDKWLINADFHGDAYYCYGEMDAQEINKRIVALAQNMGLKISEPEDKESGIQEYTVSQTGINAHSKRLITIDLRKLVGTQFDITKKEHQDLLSGHIQNKNDNNENFIVFDNYVSIIGTSTSSGDIKFNPAFEYLLSLTERGACVMLAHHTNADKEIAGTKQIERKVDGVIRLTINNVLEEEVYRDAYYLSSNSKKPSYSSEAIKAMLTKKYCPEGINVYVTYQFFRDKSAEDLKPLHMSIDLKNKEDWKCEEIDVKDIIERVTSKLSSSPSESNGSQSPEPLPNANNPYPITPDGYIEQINEMERSAAIAELSKVIEQHGLKGISRDKFASQLKITSAALDKLMKDKQIKNGDIGLRARAGRPAKNP